MRYIIFTLIGAENTVDGDYCIIDFADTTTLRFYIEKCAYEKCLSINDLVLGDSYHFTTVNHGLMGVQPLREMEDSLI
jgi:hypothetical protein